MKYIITLSTLLVSLFVFVTSISAHVSIKPAEVGVGKFQTFTVSVPNEKDNPTIAIRLVVPKGLTHVSPNVKEGWTITPKKDGETVTEITWSEGSIPEGMRDEFLFSAKAPTSVTTLTWKAYQTYQDGTVVAWDMTEEEHDAMEKEAKEHETEVDHSEKGPASVTTIVNDLSGTAVEDTSHGEVVAKKQTSAPAWMTYLTLILSVVALGLSLRK